MVFGGGGAGPKSIESARTIARAGENANVSPAARPIPHKAAALRKSLPSLKFEGNPRAAILGN